MLIPWATDAPVYHRPWGTIGLILANILIFAWELHADPGTIDDLVLRFGDGYHPVQWLTNHFLHADIMHLLGNMVFLWVFGLIVEGKLGWRRFLPLYLGICLLDSVIVQSAMLGADDGGALGASGAIFALMLISLVWAPANEISCLLFIWIVPKTFDAPVWLVCTLFLLWNVLMAALDSFAMGTAMLHLSGALVGAGAGVLAVRRKWVDCEGWDAFSRVAIWRGKAPPPAAARSVDESVVKRDLAERRAQAQVLIHEYIASGEGALALRVLREATLATGRWGLERSDLLGLIDALIAERAFTEVRPLLGEAQQRFPDAVPGLRLHEARMLLDLRRPAKALELLDALEPGALDAHQQAERERLRGAARTLVAAGVLEIDD
ncbi:MAG: rhomboid family intramembrane serine protease [Planctomycetes bacterium]|nr:rhomboid family intramembrane serine protease [Planctomycetota bacterium]